MSPDAAEDNKTTPMSEPKKQQLFPSVTEESEEEEKKEEEEEGQNNLRARVQKLEMEQERQKQEQERQREVQENQAEQLGELSMRVTRLIINANANLDRCGKKMLQLQKTIDELIGDVLY